MYLYCLYDTPFYIQLYSNITRTVFVHVPTLNTKYIYCFNPICCLVFTLNQKFKYTKTWNSEYIIIKYVLFSRKLI